jgi:hypothetical protein
MCRAHHSLKADEVWKEADLMGEGFVEFQFGASVMMQIVN